MTSRLLFSFSHFSSVESRDNTFPRLEQQSPVFLGPGIDFMEDSFSMDRR